MSTDRPIASIQDAKADTGVCNMCGLTGLVSIYHRNYVGLPGVEITDHNGEVKTIPGVIAAHCICPVGRWLRHGQRNTEPEPNRTPKMVPVTPPEISARIPDLHEVISKRIRWSIEDPRLGTIDDTIAPDWKTFREWLKDHRKPVFTKVYPQKQANRASAYREMGEPIPGSKPVMEESVPF